jgi:hypothetical protein
MVDVTINAGNEAVADFVNLLRRVEKENPRRLKTETRRTALYICQALKKRTKKAPKRIRKGEYIATPSPNPPRYIHGHGNGKPLLRRWRLTRKAGTSDAYSKDYFVYTKAHRNKRGKMVGKSQAQERSELIREHGGISRHGLAKQSWGWVAKGIYSAAAANVAWKRSRREKRDPRNYVKGLFQKSAIGADARLINKLDYILEATPPSQVVAALKAAHNRLEHNIAKSIERGQSK